MIPEVNRYYLTVPVKLREKLKDITLNILKVNNKKR